MKALRRIAVVLACATALAAAGCGDQDEGDPIPRDVVSELSQELTSVQNRVDFAEANPNARGEGACNDLEDDSFATFDRLLQRIPDGVSQDVRDALTQSVDRLQELTRSVCEDVTKQADETDTTPTAPAPTVPAPAPPPTIPPETTPTEPQTTPEEKPKQPKQNQGEGNGSGGGDEGTGGANPPGSD